MLDPILVQQHLFDVLRVTEQMEQLHAALHLIRKIVSTADDDALRASLHALPVKPRLGAWASRWLSRMDRPLAPAPLRDDPDFRPLYGADVERTALRFRNCLAQRKLHAAVARQAYLEFLPSPGGNY
jgi:hypothetical protein